MKFGWTSDSGWLRTKYALFPTTYSRARRYGGKLNGRKTGEEEGRFLWDNRITRSGDQSELNFQLCFDGAQSLSPSIHYYERRRWRTGSERRLISCSVIWIVLDCTHAQTPENGRIRSTTAPFVRNSDGLRRTWTVFRQ